MRTLHLIYLPGLGDQNPSLQAKAVALWKLWGVTSELFHINWADGETWDPKLQLLLQRIDDLHEKGHAVALVGASAGASAAINAYAARNTKVIAVICIAGKVLHPGAVSNSYRRKNPAFITSIHDSPAAYERLSTEDRKRILSRFALADPIVPARDSRLPGAINRVVPSIGHVFTIGSQLTLGAPSFIQFIKSCAQNQA